MLGISILPARCLRTEIIYKNYLQKDLQEALAAIEGKTHIFFFNFSVFLCES